MTESGCEMLSSALLDGRQHGSPKRRALLSRGRGRSAGHRDEWRELVTGVSLARLRYDPQVWLWRLPAAREFQPCLLVRDGLGYKHIAALHLVGWRGDRVFGGQLDRVEQPEDLVKVSTTGQRIRQHRLDLLVGTYNEYCAHGGIVRWRPTL